MIRFWAPSGLPWYCSETSGFDILCSGHALVVIFEWLIALGAESKWYRYGPHWLFRTAGNQLVSDFETQEGINGSSCGRGTIV